MNGRRPNIWGNILHEAHNDRNATQNIYYFQMFVFNTQLYGYDDSVEEMGPNCTKKKFFRFLFYILLFLFH